MKSLSGVGLGLSIVFGCLLLALVGEVYYLFWWKRRSPTKEIRDKHIKPGRDFFSVCFREQPSARQSTEDLFSSVGITYSQEPDQNQQEINRRSEDLFKQFSDQQDPVDGLPSPPRLLFTIVEETKEDLESEGGRSRGDNSSKNGKGSGDRKLSDLLLSEETPYLTPLASPSFFTPPFTPMDCRYYHHEFNFLSGVSTDAEFCRIKSSPPPKFKFLQDAEEKMLIKMLLEEAEKKSQMLDGSMLVQDNHKSSTCSKSPKGEEDGNFVTSDVYCRNKEKMLINQLPQCCSSTSQVIPLYSSPFQHSN